MFSEGDPWQENSSRTSREAVICRMLKKESVEHVANMLAMFVDWSSSIIINNTQMYHYSMKEMLNFPLSCADSAVASEQDNTTFESQLSQRL